MLALLFHSFVALVISLLVLMFAGRFVKIIITGKRRNETSFEDSFFSLLFGLMTLVIVYAMIMSRFKTIFVVLVPVIAVLAYLYRVKPKQPQVEVPRDGARRHHFSFIALLVVFCFFAKAYALFQGAPFPLIVTDLDSVFYSNVSQYLHISGQENFHHANNVIDPVFLGTKQYHYFELWLAGILEQCTGLLNIVAYKTVMLPLLMVTLGTGLLAIIEQKRSLRWIDALLVVLAFFIQGLLLPALKHMHLFQAADNLVYSALSYEKLAPIYLFLVAAVLEIRRGNNALSLAWLACLPVVSFVALPSVAGGVTIYLFYLLFRKRINLAGFLISIAGIGVVCLAILVFYKATGNRFFADDISSGLTNGGSWGAFLKSKGIQFVKISAGSIIQLGVLYLLFLAGVIAAIVVGIRKEGDSRGMLDYTVLVMGVTLASLAGWTVLSERTNAVQILNNVLLPALNILSFLAISELFYGWFSGNRRPILIVGLGVSSLGLLIAAGVWGLAQKKTKTLQVQAYGSDYLQKVKALIDGNSPGPIGAYIKEIDTTVTAHHEFNNDQNPLVYNLGTYLGLIKNKYATVSVSNVFAYDTTTAVFKEFTCKSPFYQFVRERGGLKDPSQISQFRMEFLKLHNIHYLILGKGAKLEPELQSLVSKSAADPVSGEQFFILK